MERQAIIATENQYCQKVKTTISFEVEPEPAQNLLAMAVCFSGDREESSSWLERITDAMSAAADQINSIDEEEWSEAAVKNLERLTVQLTKIQRDIDIYLQSSARQ